MQLALIEKIAEWIRSDPDDHLGMRDLKAKVDFLADVLFFEYRPTLAGTHGFFKYRLAKWLNSAPQEAQQKLMFLMLRHLFFVGTNEFDSMYMTAYSRHVAQWIMTGEQVQISSPDADAAMHRALERTLFTAITDSFNIGDFIRVNQIAGAGPRFNWKQGLELNWDPNCFERDLLGCRNRVVLLEDFVGSGDQMVEAIVACCQLPSMPQVLLCPLIICPGGAEVARRLCAQFHNLAYRPVLELEKADFVSPTPAIPEPMLFAQIRDLVVALHPLVAGTGAWRNNYGAYGFEETGSLVVKYDNCPDNTLPMIHHESNSPWHPLFLRVPRLAP